jgi:hypothetical protein
MKKFGMIFAVLALSACGIPVSQECKDVMALTDDDCTGGQAIADSYSDLDTTYGEGGTCWTNADTAKACTDACKASLDTCTDAGGDAGT